MTDNTGEGFQDLKDILQLIAHPEMDLRQCETKYCE